MATLDSKHMDQELELQHEFAERISGISTIPGARSIPDTSSEYRHLFESLAEHGDEGTEEDEEELRREDNDWARRRRRLSHSIPAVPDLRFEQSYLRAVRPYVRVERVSAGETKDEKGKGIASEEISASHPQEVITVDWGRLAWITTRDQVLSPLIQGALWGVAGYYLTPMAAVLRTRISNWWARGAVYSPNGLKVEGHGVGRLRYWFESLTSGIAQPRLAK